MACVFHGCTETQIHKDCTRWNIGDVCTKHFANIEKKIQTNCSELDKTHVADFARIEVLMRNNSLVVTYLRRLNDDMSKLSTMLNESVSHELDLAVQSLIENDEDVNVTWKSGPQYTTAPKAKKKSCIGPHTIEVLSDRDYMRLSRLLEFFESLCWFPSTHLLPIGILDAKEFFWLIENGYMVKDYGAGIEHGEFTHRLQWHCISRAITKHFTVASPNSTGWNHSPLDLYTTLGKKKAQKSVGGDDPEFCTQQSSLWGYLLDAPSVARYVNRPEKFHQVAREELADTQVGQCLVRRKQKRVDELTKVALDKRIEQRAAEKVVPEIYANKKLKSGKYEKDPKVVGGGAILKLTGDALVDESSLRNRVAKSKAGFQNVNLHKDWTWADI